MALLIFFSHRVRLWRSYRRKYERTNRPSHGWSDWLRIASVKLYLLAFLILNLYRTYLITWSIKFPSDPSLRSGCGVRRGVMTSHWAQLRRSTWYFFLVSSNFQLSVGLCWFSFTSICDLSRKFAPPILSWSNAKLKPTRVFPRFRPIAYLTLVSWWLIVCVFVVLTGRLVYDTQLKCVFSVIELEFSTGLFFC